MHPIFGKFNKENILYSLLFLYPIAGLGVRHWYSSIFVLIAFISLFSFRENLRHQDPTINERRILWLFVLFFISYLTSMAVNGWVDVMGVELRFLLYPVVFYMMLSLPNAYKYLIAGTIAACIFIIGIAFYEIVFLEKVRISGIYSPLILGPVAVLSAFITFNSVHIFSFTRKNKILVITLSFMTVVAAILSGSRGAAVVFIIVLIGLQLNFINKAKHKYVAIVAMSALLIIPGVLSNSINLLLLDAVNDIKRLEKIEFIPKDELDMSTFVTSSGMQRILYWHAGLAVAKDNIFFGIGSDRFQTLAKKYVSEKKVHPIVTKTGHMHNIYLEALLTKGMFGLILLFLLLTLIFFYYFKHRKNDRYIALMGMIHITVIAIFGLFEDAPINKGNFASIFVLYSAVLIASLHNISKKID